MTLFENTLHNYFQSNNFNQDNLNTNESNFENLVKKINELVDECLPHAVGPAAHEVRGAIDSLLSNESRDVRQMNASKWI